MPSQSILKLLCCAAFLLCACGEQRAAWLGHTAEPPAARPAHGHVPVRIASDLLVKKVEFGILQKSADGEEHFVAAREVPAEDGQVFGWRVDVATTRETLHWQEHLKMPRAPLDWGDAADDPDVLISKDGRSVAAQGEDAIEDNRLSRFYWALAPGDPAGEYELDLAVEGKTVGHFAFRVPAPVAEKPILVRHVPARDGRHGLAGLTRVALLTGAHPAWR